MADEIVFRFTPQFEGQHLRGVPTRDLTQRDVDRMSGAMRNAAFGPHPEIGKPLYTPTPELAERICQEHEAATKQQIDEEKAAADLAAEEAKAKQAAIAEQARLAAEEEKQRAAADKAAKKDGNL